MKVYELLSDGSLILLPDFVSEEEETAGVRVMLPWGRQLLGESVLGFERWSLVDPQGKKLGGEKILYDSMALNLPELGGLVISAENCRHLRDALLGQIAPPGNHRMTLQAVESLWPHHGLFASGPLWPSEAEVIPQLHFSDGSLQLYWGLRLALFRNDSAMKERLSLWASQAADILHGRSRQVRMWLSPSSVAPERARKVFLEQDLNSSSLVKMLGEAKVMAMKSEEMAMIRSEGREAFGRAFVCAWICLSRNTWERLLKRMDPERAVLCIWGHVDGLNAVAEMSRYSMPAQRMGT